MVRDLWLSAISLQETGWRWKENKGHQFTHHTLFCKTEKNRGYVQGSRENWEGGKKERDVVEKLGNLGKLRMGCRNGHTATAKLSLLESHS